MDNPYDLAAHLKKVKVLGEKSNPPDPQSFLKALAEELDEIRKSNG